MSRLHSLPAICPHTNVLLRAGILPWPRPSPGSGELRAAACKSLIRCAYPELAALMGATVPDLRGLFLRGVGGNAAALGIIQGDAMRRLQGSVVGGGRQIENFLGDDLSADGVFSIRNPGSKYGIQDDSNLRWGADALLFDNANVTPTAEENRPINQAVRYLIRAL